MLPNHPTPFKMIKNNINMKFFENTLKNNLKFKIFAADIMIVLLFLCYLGNLNKETTFLMHAQVRKDERLTCHYILCSQNDYLNFNVLLSKLKNNQVSDKNKETIWIRTRVLRCIVLHKGLRMEERAAGQRFDE